MNVHNVSLQTHNKSTYFRIGRPSGPSGENALCASFANSAIPSDCRCTNSGGRHENDIDEDGSRSRMLESPLSSANRDRP